MTTIKTTLARRSLRALAAGTIFSLVAIAAAAAAEQPAAAEKPAAAPASGPAAASKNRWRLQLQSQRRRLTRSTTRSHARIGPLAASSVISTNSN